MKKDNSKTVKFVIILVISIALMVLGVIFKDEWWGKGFFVVSIVLLVPMLRIAFKGTESSEEEEK